MIQATQVYCHILHILYIVYFCGEKVLPFHFLRTFIPYKPLQLLAFMSFHSIHMQMFAKKHSQLQRNLRET